MGSQVQYIDVRSRSRQEMIDITQSVREQVKKLGVREGVCHLVIQHTTAGLTINEGADPTVQSDMLRFLQRTIPVDAGFSHAEGNSDAHIKASLVGSGATVIVADGDLLLGTWQAIYVCEFDGPRQRRVAMKVIAG